MHYTKLFLTAIFFILVSVNISPGVDNKEYFEWQSLPDLPAAPGVGGAFTGVHNDVVILAGGANFAEPVWENKKEWSDRIWVLRKINSPEGEVKYEWRDGGRLDYPVGYGGSVSTNRGVFCIGGCDGETVFEKVFILRWDDATASVKQEYLPSLPAGCVFTSATMVGDKIYLAGGQRGLTLDTATNDFLVLDTGNFGTDEFGWQELEGWPGPNRAFHITTGQHNGFANCVYVMSGRRSETETSAAEFLNDFYEYNPSGDVGMWRKRADVPACVMAGAGHLCRAKPYFRTGRRSGRSFCRGRGVKTGPSRFCP